LLQSLSQSPFDGTGIHAEPKVLAIHKVPQRSLLRHSKRCFLSADAVSDLPALGSCPIKLKLDINEWATTLRYVIQ
jgi:hypothetical protein